MEQLNHASSDLGSSICWYLNWHCVQGVLSLSQLNVGWHAVFVFFDFADALRGFFLAFCSSCSLALAILLSLLAATFSAWSAFFFLVIRGKINIGGTYTPCADTQQTTVIFLPRSALVKMPTFFFPFLATISLWFLTHRIS